jgi:hypothetical protein
VRASFSFVGTAVVFPAVVHEQVEVEVTTKESSVRNIGELRIFTICLATLLHLRHRCSGVNPIFDALKNRISSVPNLRNFFS